MLVLFLDHEWNWCRVKALLKLFDATLLDSNECICNIMILTLFEYIYFWDFFTLNDIKFPKM